MATADEVKKLATLARLRVNEDEVAEFAEEFDRILAYVGQVESLSIPAELKDRKPLLRNVFRKDEEPHAPRAFTDAITAQFPLRHDDKLQVKQIISQD